jgi:hypothetical protein
LEAWLVTCHTIFRILFYDASFMSCYLPMSSNLVLIPLRWCSNWGCLFVLVVHSNGNVLLISWYYNWSKFWCILPCLDARKTFLHSFSSSTWGEQNIAGNEFGGFRCSPGAVHLQCNGCRGMMPIRSNISIPKTCRCQF